MKIEVGNLEELNKENPQRKGWFVGSFMPKDSVLYDENCEAKWSKYPKGFTKVTGINPDVKSRSVIVLVSGKWKLKLPETGQEIILSEPGDYIASDDIYHESEALEDSQVFVVRWFIKD